MSNPNADNGHNFKSKKDELLEKFEDAEKRIAQLEKTGNEVIRIVTLIMAAYEDNNEDDWTEFDEIQEEMNKQMEKLEVTHEYKTDEGMSELKSISASHDGTHGRPTFEEADAMLQEWTGFLQTHIIPFIESLGDCSRNTWIRRRRRRRSMK